MTQRTTPTPDNKTSESKLATDNYDRLLKILERNAASAHEPELIARLRETIARLRAVTEERNGCA
jgi:hypothetical protein